MRHRRANYSGSQVQVSIHAPREGCDRSDSFISASSLNVSIHAPREGCDLLSRLRLPLHHSFNSRTPGGVRPRREAPAVTPASSFNSRTPGGVRLANVYLRRPASKVSIHAPREGCDAKLSGCSLHHSCFNSRTPGGVRPSEDASLKELGMFQFTHPGRGAT